MTDDRQQHIDAIARALPCRTCGAAVGRECHARVVPPPHGYRHMDAERVFDSTDPAVHSALTAALIAHADRGRVLAALADAGWLDAQWRPATKHFVIGYMPESEARRSVEKHGAHWYLERRYLTPWEPTP